MTHQERSEKPVTSGFDMSETIGWYKNSKVDLPPLPDASELVYPIENREQIELTDQEIAGLLALFPEAARKRSVLKKIVGKPMTWFGKTSTPEKPVPTTDPKKAMSPTAIIPSYIDYLAWKPDDAPAAEIQLYQIDPKAVPEPTRKIILAEGLVHEFAHSIIQPALLIEDYDLRFSDGRIVNGFDAILGFANLAEVHAPISHYASTYRGETGKFESKSENYDALKAISEELAETIAAYLLGFAFCGQDARSRQPFSDRPEIEKFVKDFLNAELIQK